MVHELAGLLIGLETPRGATPATPGSGVARVIEKLRVTISRLAGKAGYHALISRAVSLAKADAPALNPMQVRADGFLVGFDAIVENDAEAGVTVLVHLLDLLSVFVGMPLTLSLVRDTWPDSTFDITNLSAEEQS